MNGNTGYAGGHQCSIADTIAAQRDEKNRVITKLQAEVAVLNQNELHLRSVIEEQADWGRCKEEWIAEISKKDAIIEEMQEVIAYLVAFVPDLTERKKYLDWLSERGRE